MFKDGAFMKALYGVSVANPWQLDFDEMMKILTVFEAKIRQEGSFWNTQ